MARVVSDINRHLALEVVRGEKSVAYVTINGSSIDLQRQPKHEFDRAYCLEPRAGMIGIEPTPRHFARIMLGDGATHRNLSEEAASALLQQLPLDPKEPRSNHSVILLASSGNLIGSYESERDAGIAAQYFEGATIVRGPADLSNRPAEQIDALRKQVAPALKARGRKLIEGVYTMALQAAKAEAPAPKKIDKVVKERAPRADGPIAKIKGFVEANLGALRDGRMTRADAVAALLAQGLMKGTIGVQLGKWFKVYKIEVVRGARAKKDGEAKVPKAKKEAAPAAKPAKEAAPAKAKKEAAAPAPKAAKKEATKAPAKPAAPAKGKKK